VKRRLFRILAATGLLAILVYTGDLVSVRYGIPKGRATYGSVTVNDYLAIQMKDGKVEYDYVGTVETTCTNSLFPQLGHAPCWWLRRHREKRENL
jgi:hypothetical protein